MDAAAMTLITPTATLPDVARNEAIALERLGIRCVADLLLHAPTRYQRMLGWRSIADAIAGVEADTSDDLEIRGEVISVRRGFGRRPRIDVAVEDPTGELDLIFFNQPWMQKRLHPGMRLQATGRPREYRNRIQIANPRWDRLDDDASLVPPDEDAGPELHPVYPASDDITSHRIKAIIRGMLDDAVALLEDHLPDAYRQSHGLPSLAEAYRHLHAPVFESHVQTARRRLILDELLLLQLGVMMKRYHRRTHLHAPTLEYSDDIQTRIAARLPFVPTDAQRRVMNDIAEDMRQPIPMNRLLQGDVGSGKTAVALAAMLQAVANSAQAAMVAPTELLAEQHYRTLKSMLADAPLRLELLTGSCQGSVRTEIQTALAHGDIDILVGTHAVLTEDIEFRHLGVAVTDEQHRFGVHQRAALRNKSSDETHSPHQLVMTATPIPRTLSLTIFGDLDVSVLDEMPPGRSPVRTDAVDQSGASAVYEDVAKRVQAGDRGFVVVPVIDESVSGLTDLHTHLKYLQNGPLRTCRIEAMHGRLNTEERDAIMERFRSGDIDVLVTTTVIEVGVDVPEASIIVIEHADRFGLAQLHQLRGRVGRGTAASRCVLIADPATDDGKKRIEAMVDTHDGFQIAERDLEIRGPGDLFGTRQSGVPPFRFAALPRDLELLALARRDAETWITNDPLLTAEPHALIRIRMLKAHGQWLGLGDVG